MNVKYIIYVSFIFLFFSLISCKQEKKNEEMYLDNENYLDFSMRIAKNDDIIYFISEHQSNHIVILVFKGEKFLNEFSIELSKSQIICFRKNIKKYNITDQYFVKKFHQDGANSIIFQISLGSDEVNTKYYGMKTEDLSKELKDIISILKIKNIVVKKKLENEI